jgi:hypothetical protein
MTLGCLILSLIIQGAVTSLSVPREGAIPDFTTSEAGNPFIEGWYADPDTAFYNNEYWIFPTSSYPYEQQTYLDAFSSPDLINWTKHPNILTNKTVTWIDGALWAPAAVARNGKYYLYFGANDQQRDEVEAGIIGGIGVAIADKPEGPYIDALGKPLIGEFYNGAQPIDQDVFIDDDGQAYMYYGGHGHANVAKLNDDMVSFGIFDDGTTFKEITPQNYVEGPQMFKRNGIYYLMWSEGVWTGPNYFVSYAMSSSPLGPFVRIARILQQDSAVARGSGHNGVINVPGTDIWYITYHRRPLSETDGNHRVTCYDRMYFDEYGLIQNINMLVKDNFSDGKMIAWKISGGGAWSVQDQKLKGSGSITRSLAMLDTNFSDVVFDAVLSSFDFSTSIPALIFRASSLDGTGSYYWVRLRSDRIEVGITAIGFDEILGTSSKTFEAGIEYHIRIVAIGTLISVFVDNMNAAAVAVVDQGLRTGANGVGVDGVGESYFDNVSVARP